MNTTTHLIYAGGTFGSHGVPLSPLPAEIFLPILKKECLAKIPNTAIDILPTTSVKDSSTLTPSDFVEFYRLILMAYAKGVRRFVLITGTDSLSFLSAFLANAFADFTDISLVITGSMQPLLISNKPTHTINEISDAWSNLHKSIIATTQHTGVFVQFHHKLMDAFDTQKLNSQEHDAFIGKLANTALLKTDQTVFNKPLVAKLAELPTMINHAKDIQITAIYCLPNDVANLEYQFNHLSQQTKAVILIGFGAGNVPSSQKLIDILKKLQTKKVRVICTTMCAFGGTNDNYMAGAWQYEYGIEPSKLGVAGIYGQTLWQALQ